MAQVAGQRTSYDGASYTITPLVPQKRAIADLIEMIDPYDIPFLKYLGIGPEGKGGQSKVAQFRIQNWPSTKVEWLEDDLQPLSTTLGATMAATATTATLAVTFGSANIVRPGNVILVDNEYMLIRAVSSDSGTVTRMFGGSSGSHASGATVEIVSTARDEGDESDAGFTTQITAPYNYTQILQDEIKVSRSQNKVAQYGLAAEYDYQVAKKFKEQMRLLEKTLFHGVRNAGGSATGTGTTNPRSMGGLPVFVTTNTSALGDVALTQNDVETQIQNAWSNGGMPNLLVCNAWVKRKLSSFYASPVRTARTEKTGGVVIDQIETEFGVLGVLMTRWCPSTELWIVSTDYIGVLPFDEFFDEPLAKTGDYMRGQIVGEYTFVCKNDGAHARITGISTNS